MFYIDLGMTKFSQEKYIPFPKPEHNFYQKELLLNKIINTLRVSKDANKYQIGDIVTPFWKTNLLIKNIEKFHNLNDLIKKYPYYEKTLTENQKENIEKFSPETGITRLSLSKE